MTAEPITRELVALYLRDALPPGEAARVERAMRDNPTLLAMQHEVREEFAIEPHSIGGIWLQHRLSCPSNEELIRYQEDVLPSETAGYIEGHLKLVGCVYCQSFLDDLRFQQSAAETEVTRQARQKRILDSLRVGPAGSA